MRGVMAMQSHGPFLLYSAGVGMAIPRVFISSTWYDLKYIRENLRYFVKTLGYEPVLSEEGSVFYDPSLHTHDA
jgi:hypothetical protein